MSVSLTSARSMPKRRIVCDQHHAPATITSPRPAPSPAARHAPTSVIAARSPSDLLGLGEREPGAMDAVGVVAIEPERERLQRGRASPPRRRTCAPRATGTTWPRPRAGRRRPRPPARRVRPAGGSWRTWRSVIRTLPICVETACSARPGRSPDDELRRTAADVLHEERAPPGSSPCVPPRNDSAASCSPVMISAPPLCWRTAPRRPRGSPRRARRSSLPRGCARPPALGRVGRRWRARPRCAPALHGPRRPVRSTSLPSRVMTMSRASSVGGVPGRLDHEQPDRVRALVDRSHASRSLLGMDRLDLCGDPGADWIVAARQLVGVVRVQALHAGAGAGDPTPRRVPPRGRAARSSA